MNARPGAAPGALLVGQAAGEDPVDLGDGVSLRLLAPDAGRVQALQREWDTKLPGLLGAVTPAARAEAAAYVDSSVFNLASLVALVEARQGSKRRRLLLTGDARGDDILAGAERAGLLSGGKLRVNLLKLPHHGSDRNVETDFFRTVTADHYVVSGDGRHHNPERATFEMLIAARGDARYTIHLTYPWDEYRSDYPADELKLLFEHHQAA